MKKVIAFLGIFLFATLCIYAQGASESAADNISIELTPEGTFTMNLDHGAAVYKGTFAITVSPICTLTLYATNSDKQFFFTWKFVQGDSETSELILYIDGDENKPIVLKQKRTDP